MSQSRVWLVRAGGYGEDEQAALDGGLAIIGFADLPDLGKFRDREQVAQKLLEIDRSRNEHRAGNRARQVWTFRAELQKGDIVVLPRKGTGQIALGKVMGEYKFQAVNGELRHTRPVNWVSPDVPRSVFGQDLLYSFGAFMTVCEITRNNAAERVAAVLARKTDPGAPSQAKRDPNVPAAEEGGADFDIAQAAHDEITAYIRRKFQAHEFARLIDAILRSEGYVTHFSLPGRDGGADILAARGALGLDGPKLCVQVKATESPADVTVFRSLQGSMSSFGAEQGLLVCWGGFNQPTIKESRQHIFTIRLWDQSDVVNALYKNYETLPAELQAELPLKKVWTLVREEPEP
jgi:restriction system protein